MTREFTDPFDKRLVSRSNKILSDLFRKSVHSVRQFIENEADAKGVYRFLQNDKVSEKDITKNLVQNCQKACAGKFVVCIKDTTEVNLSNHGGRIKKDNSVGTTNAKRFSGIGVLYTSQFSIGWLYRCAIRLF
jgi:hypothetical protein